MSKGIHNKTTNCFRACCAVFLLVLYITGNTQFEGFHKLFHAHQVVADHSIANEKDPCHRSIYHHEKNKDLHRSHLIKAENCNLCHVFFHTDQLTFADSSCKFIPSGSAFTERLIAVQLTDIIVQLPLRAPPVI